MSRSVDNKRNPLTFHDKYQFMSEAFPNVNIVDNNEISNPFKASRWLSENNYKDVLLVVGSDRLEKFKRDITSYINHIDESKRYNFEEFDVISSGERLSESSDVSGVSASKARQLAMEGKFEEFSKIIPIYNRKIVKSLYNKVRTGLGVRNMSETEKMRNLINKLSEGPTDGAMISPFQADDNTDRAFETSVEIIRDFMSDEMGQTVIEDLNALSDRNDKLSILRDLFGDVAGLVKNHTEEEYGNYDLFTNENIRDMLKNVLEEYNVLPL